MQKKTEKRIRLKKKIRAKLSGTSARPRLSIFRSNKFIYAQVIDDTRGVTLIFENDLPRGKAGLPGKGTKRERARAVGMAVAEACKGKGIEAIVFDRSGFKYAGRVKHVADGARAGGLKF